MASRLFRNNVLYCTVTEFGNSFESSSNQHGFVFDDFVSLNPIITPCAPSIPARTKLRWGRPPCSSSIVIQLAASSDFSFCSYLPIFLGHTNFDDRALRIIKFSFWKKH